MPADQTQLFDALQNVVRAFRRQFDANAREMGLTLSRARLIRTLTLIEGATQAELAAELGIEAPSAKRQIDALERDGFIERRGLEGDARKRALYLTDRAREKEISRFSTHIRAQALEGIPPEDIATARRVLEQVTENIAEYKFE
ncbi:MarR family winged helix-turn-helix transcriptional regulator [Pseudooceanicola sp. 502str34]|jgi:MarR family transcriptional regulator for hemolysin|uniref:MarR family winged helix-turn-helix transcriptional regulator n=1 Tax=Maritimibacter alkaliphilus TaxID=404236 RepID=UPI001C96C0E3|nr:MarR family transcriptional regulator [Maritimibacter alkaliphilus]MBY6092767.1 MarR family transcriptional regulator [Maritimibacter alkaliphilus]